VTPGSINLKVVADRLELVSACLADLRGLPTAGLDEFRSDWRNAAASESNLRGAIEALLDVARHLLARGHGVGALEYREVARLAGEKGLVADPALRVRFLEIAGFRNRLTHFYADVTIEELLGVLRNDLDDLASVAEALRASAALLASRQEL
jgi:uncharacterized protein YutE (UPF0331/DUF86 family)